MLAGLIFATEPADDRPDQLAATLPFGGITLVEYQARLLIAAGAAQIVLVVARMTPELLGAANRIARRAGALDVVRTVGEAKEKLHPLARVLVVADGLVTSPAAVALIAEQPGDALLAVEAGAAGAVERIGASGAWAGLALVDAKRIAEVADLPKDYAFQSTLLRVAAQGGAAQVAVPAALARAHGVERDSRRLALQGDAAVAATIAAPERWAERFCLAPLVRLGLKPLVARAITAMPPLALGGGLLGIGVLVAARGWIVTALVALVAGMVLTETGRALAALRDDRPLVRAGEWLPRIALVLALVLVAPHLASSAALPGWLAAAGLLAPAVLVERAAGVRIVQRWWASPLAYPLVLLPATLLFGGLAGVLLAAAYALATLATAIEALRDEA